MTVMVLQLYMECRNLVTVNDCYGPLYLIMEYRNLVSFYNCFDPPYLVRIAGTL